MTQTDLTKMERWGDMVGWTGVYQVSDFGRVRSIGRYVECGGRYTRFQKPKMLRLLPHSGGYSQVQPRGEGRIEHRYVHRLVLETFIGPCPEGMEARHLNGNRADNRLENLAWGTPQENAGDKVLHGTSSAGDRNGARLRPEKMKRGEENPMSKLKSSDVIAIRSLIVDHVPHREIAGRFGVSAALVSRIKRGQVWKHLEVALDSD